MAKTLGKPKTTKAKKSKKLGPPEIGKYRPITKKEADFMGIRFGHEQFSVTLTEKKQSSVRYRSSGKYAAMEIITTYMLDKLEYYWGLREEPFDEDFAYYGHIHPLDRKPSILRAYIRSGGKMRV